MTFETWGLTDAFGFELPQRWSGFLLLAFSLLLFLWIVIDHRRRHQAPIALGWPLPGGLVLAGVVAQTVLVLYFAAPGGMATPGLPRPPVAQAAPLLGMIPMVLAAGWLGIAPAAAVGLAAGLVSGGWYTHSILTPLHLALAAALDAWLLQLPYRDAIGSAMRRPMLAALVGGLVYGLARCLELFVSSGGSVLDGLEYIVAQGGIILQAALLAGVLAGVVGEAALFLAPARWRRPARFSSAPYLRSLGAADGRLLSPGRRGGSDGAARR